MMELKVAICFPKLLEDLKHFIHFKIVQKNIFHPTALLSSASFTIYNSFILGYQEAQLETSRTSMMKRFAKITAFSC